MNSFIPWVGGKGKLLWIINKLMPDHYKRFIDVFGGSGTVTISRPIQRGCMEVYNDYNGNLTNLFCCVKNRTMALLAELGFLPLNTRDDFNVLYKFFSKDEITDDYLQEEMDLTEVYLKPPDAEAIRTLMLERAPRGDIRRAADYFKLVRYSFSGGAKSFGGKPCDIRRFFHLIWECSRRLANVVIENKDFEELIRQYDRKNAVLYCDPPYRFFTMGGAKSHDIEDGILEPDAPDFERRLMTLQRKPRARYRINHISWWAQELPSDEEYDEARQSLDAVGWQVDYIITHCAPTSIALMGSRHNEADRLTDFLQEVRERAKYHYWLFGHYHDNKAIDEKHILLWEQIVRII